MYVGAVFIQEFSYGVVHFNIVYCFSKRNYKRPMGHIVHLGKQFKSMSTYDYIIMFIKRKKNIINFMRIYWFFI